MVGQQHIVLIITEPTEEDNEKMMPQRRPCQDGQMCLVRCPECVELDKISPGWMHSEADYIQDHYGICEMMIKKKKCRCMKENADQKKCPNWEPMTAQSWDELQEMLNKKKPTT